MFFTLSSSSSSSHFLEKDGKDQLTTSVAAKADAACVAELFSGGRLWSTFVQHVAEFAPWRENETRDETVEIDFDGNLRYLKLLKFMCWRHFEALFWTM